MSESPDYSLLDAAGLSSQIFFPRPDHSHAGPSAEDVTLDLGDGVGLGARFYRHRPESPTVLYWHGNGEVVGDHDEIAPMYAEAGANLFVADFRGYGRSGGRPTFANLVADGPRGVRRMLEHLDTRGFGGTRYVMGRSLGSHPALEVAAQMAGEVAGVIIESGASSIAGVAGRLGPNVDSAAVDALVAGHEAKIRSITMPALILHGEWDELIPLERAAWLYNQIGSTEKELVTIPQAGHNDILWVGRLAYFEAIRRFVAS